MVKVRDDLKKPGIVPNVSSQLAVIPVPLKRDHEEEKCSVSNFRGKTVVRTAFGYNKTEFDKYSIKGNRTKAIIKSV